MSETSLGSTSESSGELDSVGESSSEKLNASLVGTPDEELAVWPSKVNFIEPWGHTAVNEGEQTQKLKLTNTHAKETIVFRILVTSSEMYSIKPKAGFIPKGKQQIVTVKLKNRDRVKKLTDQGLQIETLYWKGNKLGKKERNMAYQHFKCQRAPHAILQRVRIYYPPDVAHNVPQRRRLED